MAKRLFSLIALGLCVVILPIVGFASPKQIFWKDLKPEEQQALSPIAKEFDTLPEVTRDNLYKAALRYPKLSPAQQVRFQNRLPTWAKLHPEERKAAREKYKKFKALPPEQRKEVKEKWHEREAKKNALPSKTNEKSSAPNNSLPQPATTTPPLTSPDKANQ